MDRFERGLKDAQEAKVVCYCDNCGGEIYEGNTYYRTGDSENFCRKDCVLEYFDATERTAGEE